MNTQQLVSLTSARTLARSGRARDIRRAAKLSLSEVAGACGVSVATIHRWENGDRIPHGPPALSWAELMRALEDAS